MTTPAIEVFGPYTISAAVGTGTFKLLGRGDNDDLFKLDISYTFTDIFTNESGTMPFDSIRTGAKAECSFSLIVIDRAELSLFTGLMDGGNTGTTSSIPKVGSIIGNSYSAANQTTCTISVNFFDGSTAKFLKVPRCRLLSQKHSDFGNKATRIAFSFEALPDATGGAIAADANFYTITT